MNIKSRLAQSYLKLLFGLFLLGGMIGSLQLYQQTMAQTTPPSLTLTTPTNIGIGETVDIEVWTNDVTDLGAYQFNLSFDNNLVQVNAIFNEDYLSSTGRTVSPLAPVIDNSTGSLTAGAFSFGSNAGPTGSGQIATIRLTTLAEGSTNLMFSAVSILATTGTDLIPDIIDGTLTIGSDPSPTPTVELTPAPEDPPGARFYFDGPTNNTVGESFELSVMMDTDGEAVIGADVLLRFDPTYVTVHSVSLGSDFDTHPSLSTNNVDGTLTFSGVMNPGNSFTGTSTLATLIVQPLMPGTTTFDFIYETATHTDSNIIAQHSGSDILTSASSIELSLVETADLKILLLTPSEDETIGFGIDGLLTVAESTFSANLSTNTSGSSSIVPLDSSFIGQLKGFMFKTTGYLSERVDQLVIAGLNVIDFGLIRAGDLNDDGIVNTVDLAIMYDGWFLPGISDFNRDGITNSADYWHLTQNYFAVDE